MPAALVVPKGLTDAEWQKEKGKIAKLAGKTGVGEALKKFQASYKAIDFSKFDAKMACPGAKLPSVVSEALKTARSYHADKVEKARNDLKDARDTANDTAKAFKKNKLIPSSATKAAETIAKAADQFYIVMKKDSVYFTECWKSFQDLIDELERRAEEGRKSLAGYIVSIEKDGADVLKNPTGPQYHGSATKGFHQGIRGLNAALATQDDPTLKDFHGKWKVFSQDGYKPKVDAAESVIKEKVNKVLQTLQSLKPLVK